MRPTCDDNLTHSTILFSNPTTEQLVQRSVGAWPFSNTLLPHPAGWTGTGAFLHRGHTCPVTGNLATYWVGHNCTAARWPSMVPYWDASRLAIRVYSIQDVLGDKAIRAPGRSLVGHQLTTRHSLLHAIKKLRGHKVANDHDKGNITRLRTDCNLVLFSWPYIWALELQLSP